MMKWILEKPQQVMGKINRVEMMLGKFQYVQGKIVRTPEVQGRLKQVIDKADQVLSHPRGFQRHVGS